MKILFEDQDVLVVDKPAGISVHAGPGNLEQTVADIVKGKVEDDGTGRCGIVHRLDKDTSGVLIIAKTTKAREFLQQQFKDRKVNKTYLALVAGAPSDAEATIELPLGRNPKNPLKRAVRGSGKAATSSYIVSKRYSGRTLLEVHPTTGRTHQIRVHLAYIGCPVVGDRLYGKADPVLNRHFLHAHKLKLKLPNGKTKEFTSQLPTELVNYLK